MKTTSGISLIEVMLVVGIVAILGTLVGVNLMGVYRQKALESNASQIAFSLRLAREKSTSQEGSSQWGVHFVNSASPHYSVFSGAVYNPSNVYVTKPLESPVTYQNIEINNYADVFFSKIYGLPSGSSSIIISLRSDPLTQKTIAINNNGEITY